MASDDSALFSREGILGGLSARRATTLLFAIENRTAYLIVESPVAVPIVLSEQAATQRERAFLEALAQGRDLAVQPTIQDLERYAPDWADLVPDDPGTRAGVAHLLGSKHALHPRGSVAAAIRAGPRCRSGRARVRGPVWNVAGDDLSRRGCDLSKTCAGPHPGCPAGWIHSRPSGSRSSSR